MSAGVIAASYAAASPPTGPFAATATSTIPTYSTYAPALMTDGDRSTYWYGNRNAAAGDTVTLDLGSVVTVNKVDAYQVSNHSLGKWTLEHSADGTTWTQVLSDAAIEVHAAGMVASARYVRLRVTAGGGVWPQMTEFTASAVPDRTTVGPLACTTWSSLPTYQSNDIWKMSDGNASTYYWSNGGPQAGSYVIADLGKPRSISSVTVSQGGSDSDTSAAMPGWVLEVSNDNATWSSLGTGTAVVATISGLSGVSARYVRLRSTAASGNWIKVREFIVNGI